LWPILNILPHDIRICLSLFFMTSSLGLGSRPGRSFQKIFLPPMRLDGVAFLSPLAGDGQIFLLRPLRKYFQGVSLTFSGPFPVVVGGHVQPPRLGRLSSPSLNSRSMHSSRSPVPVLTEGSKLCSIIQRHRALLPLHASPSSARRYP